MNVFVLLNTKEDILNNVGNRAVLVFFFLLWKSMVPKTACLQTFFKISSFVFRRTKTFIKVWNYSRMSTWWPNFHFWVNCLFKVKSKSNHFYCHITTAQVPWWVKFLWACSRQCRKTTDNLHMDRQCKKLHWSIYSAPDSAKKTTRCGSLMNRKFKRKVFIWYISVCNIKSVSFDQFIMSLVNKSIIYKKKNSKYGSLGILCYKMMTVP